MRDFGEVTIKDVHINNPKPPFEKGGFEFRPTRLISRSSSEITIFCRRFRVEKLG